MSDKARIIELHRSLEIARKALEKIRHGRSFYPERDAEAALTEIQIERQMRERVDGMIAASINQQ